MYRTSRLAAFVTLLLGVTLASSAVAQPAITLPNGGSYKAGPDFAADVLQDPWDFENAEDITPDPSEVEGWASPPPATIRTIGTGPAFLSDGLLRGVASGDTGFFILRRPDAFTINPGRTGARFPIETARYSKLAMRMRVSGAAAPNNLVVYWFHRLLSEGADHASRLGFASVPVPTGTTDRIYVIDLLQHDGGYPYLTDPLAKGLRIDPVHGAGEQIEIDWVRLTTPNTHADAALMPVAVAGCTTLQSFTFTDINGAQTLVTDIESIGGTPHVNYGILPPGNYNIRATCGNGTSAPLGFVINTPPRVTVLDPDERGDPSTDYALEVKGDPWDFEQPTDLARAPAASNLTVTQGECAAVPCGLVPAEPPGSGLMFRASAWGDLGDPQVWLLDQSLIPLNSRRHEIVSFSLRNRRVWEASATTGPVLRFFWGSDAVADGNHLTTSQDMWVWPGFRTYTVNLGDLTVQNGGIETPCGPNCRPWRDRGIRHFRIDPHEYNHAATAFDIDTVTLTAPDGVARGGTFAVRYRFEDPDPAGSTYTARIYRSDWPTRANSVLLDTIAGVTPGTTHTYTLNPVIKGMVDGRYTIAVEVDEVRAPFVQTSQAWAQGPLVVTDPTATLPRLSVSSPAPEQAVGVPFNIQGCAYDEGRATGQINMDDVVASMTALSGARIGMVLPLGMHPLVPHTGVVEFLPLTGTPVPCPTASGPYANAGFRFVNIGGGVPAGWLDGRWEIDVRARSTISGEMIQLAKFPIRIGPVPPPAPVNFQASAQGTTVTVSWEAPPAPVASYQIQGGLNDDFSQIAFSLDVGAAGTYHGQLASGRYYLRVYARTQAGLWSDPSATRMVDVDLPTPPGAPVLSLAQVSSNPVTISWTPGPGGTPSSYTVHAGTVPGASDLAIAPVGAATSISAVAPVGPAIYVRVVAANAAGSAVSNEESFTLARPAPPTLNPAVVTDHAVTLSWSPGAGPPPSGYTVLARFPGSPEVIATLPVAGTSFSVVAPAGTYSVTVMAHTGLGSSAESNPITVQVPQP